MEYRPGRALRTTSAAKFRAIVLWSVWGLAGGYAIRALQLDPILWVVLLAVPFGWTTLIKGRLRSYNTAAQPAQAALKQADGVDRQPCPCGKLLLGEAGRLAVAPELRPKRAGMLVVHSMLILR